jgi:DNA repair exonuclease SbcCD ATPase subunit
MRRALVTLVALTTILVACSRKEPAERAQARVETALSEVRTDAQQYASDQLQAVDTRIQGVKEQMAKEDWAPALAAWNSVHRDIEALKTSVAEAKAEAEAMHAAAQTEWNELSASVPPLVEKLQARVDQLDKSRKYPKGVDKAAFETAKSGLESLKAEWTEATSEFTAGRGADAVRKARSAKQKAEDLINQLEIQV